MTASEPNASVSDAKTHAMTTSLANVTTSMTIPSRNCPSDVSGFLALAATSLTTIRSRMNTCEEIYRAIANR
jgi:hypothetical protein